MAVDRRASAAKAYAERKKKEEQEKARAAVRNAAKRDVENAKSAVGANERPAYRTGMKNANAGKTSDQTVKSPGSNNKIKGNTTRADAQEGGAARQTTNRNKAKETVIGNTTRSAVEKGGAARRSTNENQAAQRAYERALVSQLNTPLGQMENRSTSWSMLDQTKDIAQKVHWPQSAIDKMTEKQNTLHQQNVETAKPYDIYYDDASGTWRGGESYGEYQGAQIYDAPKAQNVQTDVLNKAREEAAKFEPVNPAQMTPAQKALYNLAKTRDTTQGMSRAIESLIGHLPGRWGSGTESVLKGLAAWPYAFGETLDQSIADAKANWNNDTIASLNAQAAQLQREMNVRGLPASVRQEKLAQYNQLRAQIDALSAKNSVDMSLPGQVMMGEAGQASAQTLDGLSGWQRGLANAGLSIGQNLPNLALSAVAGPGVGLAMMAGQAGTQKMYELNARGISADESLARGLVSGGIEALTERIPLENFLNVARTGGVGAVKNVLKQMGIEATEEGASYAMNWAADKAAQDPEATFSLQELASSMAGGALSGGIMGGAGTLLNGAVNLPGKFTSGTNNQTVTTNPNSDTIRAAIENAGGRIPAGNPTAQTQTNATPSPDTVRAAIENAGGRIPQVVQPVSDAPNTDTVRAALLNAGANPALFEENTAGEANTPSRNVSKVSSNTFSNSRIFNDAEKQSMKIFDKDGESLYDVTSEKASMQNAQNRLNTDYEGEKTSLSGKPNFSGEDNDTAMGILYHELETARESGNYSEVEKWAKLIREKGTEGGQFIQSFAKYSRTPAGIVVQGQREVDAALKYWQKTNPNQVKTLQSKGYLVWTAEDMKQVSDFMEQAQSAGIDTREGRTLEAKAMSVIARRLPVKNQSKVVSLLMDNMLGNFRTLLTRNAGGNLAFSAPEAIRENFVAAPIDALASLLTKQRTTYFDPLGKSAAWGKGFFEGGKDMISDIKNGVHTARSGESTSVQAQQDTFRFAPLKTYDAFVGTLLEAGDRPFYEAAFAAKMRDLRRAKAEGKLTKDFAGKDFEAYAQVVAREAALEAVFQNNGTLAKGMDSLKAALNAISKSIVGTEVLGQAAAPFTRTPGNLAERAIEYSPLGMAKNAVQTGAEIKHGTFNQQRFVNETSRNLIGSGLLYVAGGMLKNGLLNGALSDDKDEREAQKNSGMQDYAIKIGDRYYSYAWIPVIGPALAGGADFYQSLNGQGLDSLAGLLNDPSAGLKALGSAAGGYVQSAVFEQSALSSLSDMFGGYGNVADNIANTITGAATQAVPSLIRQIATASDPYERQTYDGNSKARTTWNAILAAIPGLRQTLPVKRDEQGEIKMASQGRGTASRFVENMILPWKTTQDVSNDVRDELNRLHETTGETKQFQNKATYKIDRNGETRQLTPEESTKYQEYYGGLSTRAIRALMQGDAYRNLTDSEKVDAVSWINSSARQYADEQFVPKVIQPQTERTGFSPSTIARNALIDGIMNNPSMSDSVKDAIAKSSVIDTISDKQAEKYEAIQEKVPASAYAVAYAKLRTLSEDENVDDANAAFRQWLFYEAPYSTEVKNLIDENLVNDGHFTPKDLDVDYSSEDSFYKSQATPGAQKRWSTLTEKYNIPIQKAGLLYAMTQGKKKAECVKDIVKITGWSETYASEFFTDCHR